MITFMMMYVTNVLCPCIHFIHSFKKMGSSDKLRDIRPMTSLHKLFRIWATQTAYYRPQEAIQCVQNKIKWMIFSIIFYRPLMTGLLSILHIWYTYSDIIYTVHFRRTSAACRATTRRSQRLCTMTMWRSNIFELIRKIRIKPPNNVGISWINLFCVSAWSFYPFLTQFHGWITKNEPPAMWVVC